MKRLSIIGLLLVLGVIGGTGCATTTIPGATPHLLDFLRVGSTTRQETVLKLGQPSASFESESILTYRIGEKAEQGYYLITPKAMLPWQDVRYSLVLVFDQNGILQKKNLVDVH
jgi:hypothetical protein